MQLIQQCKKLVLVFGFVVVSGCSYFSGFTGNDATVEDAQSMDDRSMQMVQAAQPMSEGVGDVQDFTPEDNEAKPQTMMSQNSDAQDLSPQAAPNNNQLLELHTYHFAFNSSEIASEDREAILAQARYLSAHPKDHILLAGNTDSRGSREYNVALGWRRARSVEDVLLLNGVRAEQIRDVSYGFEKPVARGHSEGDYSRNRRVEITYES
jgi:peptidoglycan-associated lipoprotein